MSQEEIQKCEEKFSRAKTVSGKYHRCGSIEGLFYVATALFQVNSILCNVARKLDYDNDKLLDLYERTAWQFEDKTGRPGSSYEVFKKVVRYGGVCVCVCVCV